MNIKSLCHRNDEDAKHRAQEECRIAAQFQHQGMSRTDALRAAYRIVNGFTSPSTDRKG